MVTRVVVHDFSGSGAFTPSTDLYGGTDSATVIRTDAFGEVTEPGGVLTGGALYFEGGTFSSTESYVSRGEYTWSAAGGPVCGMELTFKTETSGPVDIELDMNVGTGSTLADVFASFNTSSIWNGGAGGVDFVTPIGADPSAWITAKILPNGDWSIAYTGGATIVSGTQAPAAGGGLLIVASEYQDPRTAPLWIDEVALWIVDTPITVTPIVPTTTAPSLRVYPRDDGGASSTVRVSPAPKSRQASNRVGGSHM